MHAQTDPQTRPCLSNSCFTCPGSMCDGSSTGISIVSNPHFLKRGKSFVLSLVKGEVKRKVLIPNLISKAEANPTVLAVKGFCDSAVCDLSLCLRLLLVLLLVLRLPRLCLPRLCLRLHCSNPSPPTLDFRLQNPRLYIPSAFSGG